MPVPFFHGRPLPSAGEALLHAPAGAGGGSSAQGAANEEATLASLERAANALLALVADNGGGNPYHDQLGRFTTRDGTDAGGGADSKATPKPATSDDDQGPFYHPGDVLGLSKPHPKTDISPVLSVVLRFIKGAMSPLGPIMRTLGADGPDKQMDGMQELIDQVTGGISDFARADVDDNERKRVVQGLKDQVTTPEGWGSLISTLALGKLLHGKSGADEPTIPLRPWEPEPSFSPQIPEQPGESEPGKAGEKAGPKSGSDEPRAGSGIGGYAADRDSVGSHLNFIFPGKSQQSLVEALNAINSVHQDGDLKGKLPVLTKERLKEDAEGLYARSTVDSTKADHIEMKEGGTYPALTFAHEIAHWLHHQIFSGLDKEEWNGDYSTLADNEKAVRDLQQNVSDLQTKGKAVPETLRGNLRTAQAMADLQRTLDATPEVRGLRQMTAKNGIFTADAAYAQQPSEVFARAYAQYIAQASRNPDLLFALDAQRNNSVARIIGLKRYWSDENFQPVARQFDALLRAKGWLKEPTH